MFKVGGEKEERETRGEQDSKESAKADYSGVKSMGFGLRQSLVLVLALFSLNLSIVLCAASGEDLTKPVYN